MQIKQLKIKYWAPGLAAILLVTLNGCKKLIAINPPTTELVGTVVYTDSATVQTTVVGLYSEMAFNYAAYRYEIATLPGFSADEFSKIPTERRFLFLCVIFVENGFHCVQKLWRHAAGDDNAVICANRF